MPWFIPLAIAAATSAYQAIKGAKEKREARRIQAEADQRERANLADARSLAMTGMPEAQYQRALQQIYRQQALGLSGLRDRRSALAGLPALVQSTDDALLNLNAQDAAARRSAQFNALNQGNRLASITGDQAAQLRYSGQALTGAAIQNLSNAASTAALAYSGGIGSGNSGGSSVGGQGIGTGLGMSPSKFNASTTLWGPNGYRGFNSNSYAKPF